MEGKKKKELRKGLYWRGDRIWIAYSDGGQVVRESTGTDNVGEAQKILEQKHTEVLEGKHLILKKGKKVRFSEFSSGEYLDEQKETKSYKFYSQIVNRLNTFFGKYYLDDITLALAKAYRAKRRTDDAVNRGRKLSPSTINREISVLRNVLNIAVDNGRLRANPISRLGPKNKMILKEPEREYIYPDEEVAALIAAARLPLKWFILVAVNTGARFGEVAGLRWSEVNMVQRTITLTAIRTKGKRTRCVPFNDYVFKVLDERRLQRQGSPYVFENPTTGKPYKWISHEWVKLLKKCGIKPYGAPPQRQRFHDLRHTWATRQANAGTPQVAIRDMLGHVHSDTTDRYMKGTDSRMREAVNLVQFGELPVGEVIELKKAK